MTQATIRDPFISPAHLTKPERWPLPEGSIYEGVGYCAMPQLLTLRANGKALTFGFFFCRNVYNEKLGHMLKLLVSKFRPHLSARFKDIAEKQVPAKLKPIVGILPSFPA